MYPILKKLTGKDEKIKFDPEKWFAYSIEEIHERYGYILPFYVTRTMKDYKLTCNTVKTKINKEVVKCSRLLLQ